MTKSYRYRNTDDKRPILVWSGLLFFVFPLAGEIVVWLSFQSFGLTWAHENEWPGSDRYGVYPVILVPQVVSYLLVRRLDHPALSRLWQYGIVTSVIGIGSGLVLTRFDSMSSLVWGVTVVSAVSMIALVWFARRVSAESFRHSLLFICLAAAVYVPGSFIPPRFLAGPSFAILLTTYLTLLIGGGLLRGTAVWALVNTQYVVASTRTVLPAVMSILLLGSAVTPLIPALWDFRHQAGWVVGILSVGVSSLMYTGLVIALAYAVRIRRQKSPSATSSSTA